MLRKISFILRRAVNEKRPLRFLYAYFLRHLGLCKFYKIQLDGYRLKFFPTSLSATLWIYQESHKVVDEFIANYLQKGDVFVDVGANIGSITLLGASKVGERGKVFSIEAHPQTFKYLSGNVDLNSFDNIHLFNVAIGEEAGNIQFTSQTSDDQNKVVTEGNTLDSISVPVKRLEDLVDFKTIQLLKIDVEGFELFVLKGCAHLLKNVECIYFESWESHFANYGYNTKDVIEYLDSFGFEIYKSSGDEFSKVTKDYLSTKLENLVAFKNIQEFHRRIVIKKTENLSV